MHYVDNVAECREKKSLHKILDHKKQQQVSYTIPEKKSVFDFVQNLTFTKQNLLILTIHIQCQHNYLK